MHELSIATAILERVEQEAANRPGARITRVGVRVGELSGVDPDALSFGFEALVKGSSLEPLALEINFCPRRQQCRACGREFTAPDSETRCPACGHENTVCVGGEELDLAYLELDEEPDDDPQQASLEEP